MIAYKRALGGALTLAMALGAVSAAQPAGAASDDAGLRTVMHRLTTTDGVPGVLLQTRDRRGTKVLTSGVADVNSDAPVPRDSRFRIGSMTKPFVATVVLQLVGEHRVALDAPVTRYLPDLFDGHEEGDRRITVRQLLQHTSGLPDYLTVLDPVQVAQDPLVHHDTPDLVDLALAEPRTFAPGKGWSYSNTNYLIAGMLIEKVTGRPYGDEIRRRVIEPLHLRRTSVPGDATTIPGPHPRGYVSPGPGAPLMDLTEINPSVAGASGEMISSAGDIDRFLGALVGGKLLRPAQLKEMMTTRPTGDEGRAYGLGLERRDLTPCGGVYWGHVGDIFGYQTVGGATVHGTQATAMANVDPGGAEAQDADMEALVETALCGGRGRA